MTEYERRSAAFADERIEIFDLSLGRGRRGVSTIAPAPPVVGKDRAVARQHGGRRRFSRPVGGCSRKKNERRPLARSVEGYGGAVSGNYRLRDNPWRVMSVSHSSVHFVAIVVTDLSHMVRTEATCTCRLLR